jgi:predicted enzyme related to lactoylglutathione lyase
VPFDLSGATFAVHGLEGHPGADTGRVNLSFRVDDIDAAVGRFAGLGARVLCGPADEAYGRSAVVEDPDGRVVGLVQLEEPFDR